MADGRLVRAGLGLILAGTLLLAAPARAESIRAVIDRDTIAIGDTVLYTIQARGESGTVFSLPGVLDFSPFEIRSTHLDSGPGAFGAFFELQAFDLGDLTLPPLTLYYAHGETTAALSTDSFVVHVCSVLVPGDTALRPLRSVLEEPRHFPWMWLLLLLALALVLLAVLLWRLLRRKRAAVPSDLPADPWEAFLVRLNGVERMLDAGTPMKEIYSAMTEAMKHLILARDGVDTLGLTTTETLAHEAIAHWPQRAFEELRFILQDADLVKFAKAGPSREDAVAIRERVRKLMAARYQEANHAL